MSLGLMEFMSSISVFINHSDQLTAAVEIDLHAFTDGQTITLDPYYQQNSITTCTKGLRENKDKAVFISYVNFKENNSEYAKAATFEIKRKNYTSFSSFCTVSLTQGCNGFEGRSCYCNHTDADGIHRIIINRTAAIKDNEAEIRGYLLHISGAKDYSAVQMFPKVFSSSSRVLELNGQNIGPSCYVNMKTNEDQVIFTCSNTPSPCFTKIFLRGSMVASGNMSTTYTFSHQDTQVSKFDFHSSLCDDEYELSTVSCIYVWDKRLENQVDLHIIMCVLIILVFMFEFVKFIRYIHKQIKSRVMFSYSPVLQAFRNKSNEAELPL